MADRPNASAQRNHLATGALIATIATAGSLWFSESLGLVPCELCWAQRIAMYPLVVILGVGAYENRETAWRPALILSTIGLGLAGYHSYIQRTVAQCSFSGPCTAIQWELALTGLTIPNLSLLGFVFITVVGGKWLLESTSGN
jgi:disulfide bond formation protein DsbB